MIDNQALDTGLTAALGRHLRAQEEISADPPVLSLRETQDLARQLGREVRDVQLAALRAGLAPERYRRNLGTVGFEGQVRLLEATVAVVGAGGLGGWVVEGLARMGVGRLIIIDGDRFGEDNLNRQLGCTESTLGMLKAECLARRVAQINSAVQVVAHPVRLDGDNAPELLSGAQVVVDALDTLPGRFMLQEQAAKLGLPMVHGAIGGYTGQVMTIMPGDPGLKALYGGGPLPEQGIETELGNPAATPMMISAWQIQEVVKLVVGQGPLLRGRVLIMDAEFGEVTEIQLS